MLNEIERNLGDAMQVIRNVVFEPLLLPGGGATEMAVGQALARSSVGLEGVEQWPYVAAGKALEVIPRTLAENCGANVIRVMTQLRTKHLTLDNATWGIDGKTGKLADMQDLGLWEPFVVKVQTLKTAMEAACMILRIDDIVSGMAKGPQG